MAKRKWDERSVTRDAQGRFVADASSFMPKDIFDPRTMQPTQSKPAQSRQRAQQGGSMFIQVGGNARKRSY